MLLNIEESFYHCKGNMRNISYLPIKAYSHFAFETKQVTGIHKWVLAKNYENISIDQVHVKKSCLCAQSLIRLDFKALLSDLSSHLTFGPMGCMFLDCPAAK